MPTPERIVSLVPSTTETLFALGAGERVVGVTRFSQLRAFPFEEKHRAELVSGLGTVARAVLADGQLLSWDGARLRQGLPYLRSLAERVSISPSARPFPGSSP